MSTYQPRTPMASKLLFWGFLLMLALPVLDLFWDIDPTPPVQEKRAREAFPALLDGSGLTSITGRIEKFLQDRFGFRDFLLRLNARIKLHFLWDQRSLRVRQGKEGWLYYNTDEAREYQLSRHPFSPPELVAWRGFLEERQRRLAARGIRFLLVFAPTKPTIYPEYLPEDFRREGRQARLDQLLEYLEGRSEVPILDLRPAVLEARPRERLFHRTDTHWNSRGALVASAALLDRVRSWFPEVPELRREDFLDLVTYDKGGDLARFLGLETAFEEENLQLKRIAAPRAERVSLEVLGPDDAFSETWISPRSGPTTLVFRDSFGLAMVPFLAECFPRITLLRSMKIDPAWIEKERPALVIQEVIERYLQLPVQDHQDSWGDWE